MASALSASVSGARYLILIQVSSRALTFLINQALLRYLSPELLGASVQLELYSISVLYFARESLRVALQRQTGILQAVINMSYISIALGLLLAPVFAALYIRSSLPNVRFISQCLYLYGISAVLELLIEPCFVVMQQKLLYKTRALAETIGAVLACLVTFSAVMWFQNLGADSGVLPFALGQLVHALTLLVVYYFRALPMARQDNFSLFPRQILSSPGEYLFTCFSRPLMKLAINLYVQSGVKYILTQGDSILIASLASLSDQGAYALASNYGGLIARMVFQPIEETSRSYFAKLCSPANDRKITKEDVAHARTTLYGILRCYNILALVSFAVGPTISPLLLQLVAGRKWSNIGAGDVLATFCYYIPLLALNGVTEAFVAAVASHRDLQTQSVFMVAYFVGFASSAYLFLRVMELGAKGLVLANCLNMACRIVWNTRFINTFFISLDADGFHFSSALPTASSCAVSVAMASLTFTARDYIAQGGLLYQLARSCGIAVALVLTLLFFEWHFISLGYRLMDPRVDIAERKQQESFKAQKQPLAGGEEKRNTRS